ncbi:MAG: hypothetical protein ACRDPR_22995 [Nocardioidaceae bacterium]
MADRPREVEAWLRTWSPDQRQQVDWLAGRVHAAGAGVDEAAKDPGAVTGLVRQAIARQTDMLD